MLTAHPPPGGSHLADLADIQIDIGNVPVLGDFLRQLYAQSAAHRTTPLPDWAINWTFLKTARAAIFRQAMVSLVSDLLAADLAALLAKHQLPMPGVPAARVSLLGDLPPPPPPPAGHPPDAIPLPAFLQMLLAAPPEQRPLPQDIHLIADALGGLADALGSTSSSAPLLARVQLALLAAGPGPILPPAAPPVDLPLTRPGEPLLLQPASGGLSARAAFLLQRGLLLLGRPTPETLLPAVEWWHAAARSLALDPAHAAGTSATFLREHGQRALARLNGQLKTTVGNLRRQARQVRSILPARLQTQLRVLDRLLARAQASGGAAALAHQLALLLTALDLARADDALSACHQCDLCRCAPANLVARDNAGPLALLPALCRRNHSWWRRFAQIPEEALVPHCDRLFHGLIQAQAAVARGQAATALQAGASDRPVAADAQRWACEAHAQSLSQQAGPPTLAWLLGVYLQSHRTHCAACAQVLGPDGQRQPSGTCGCPATTALILPLHQLELQFSRADSGSAAEADWIVAASDGPSSVGESHDTASWIVDAADSTYPPAGDASASDAPTGDAPASHGAAISWLSDSDPDDEEPVSMLASASVPDSNDGPLIASLKILRAFFQQLRDEQARSSADLFSSSTSMALFASQIAQHLPRRTAFPLASGQLVDALARLDEAIRHLDLSQVRLSRRASAGALSRQLSALSWLIFELDESTERMALFRASAEDLLRQAHGIHDELLRSCAPLTAAVTSLSKCPIEVVYSSGPVHEHFFQTVRSALDALDTGAHAPGPGRPTAPPTIEPDHGLTYEELYGEP
ncbi:hypothetical protein H696_05854 [Fonticula alba]|uniref:Uncharacterized protein n=1 Tax=Fonticula alba TaxID=691883 RepID=A0A058Z0G0_FONAL|nr:hypothetical protein H696_05854 [Fonticula alba]KCV67745.1 hypothetical protein H696_05854 [Fonticula alba]|eukprot:XP_009497929.1 hypothetical protein H696_05854 [Fonticula alba]